MQMSVVSRIPKCRRLLRNHQPVFRITRDRGWGSGGASAGAKARSRLLLFVQTSTRARGPLVSAVPRSRTDSVELARPSRPQHLSVCDRWRALSKPGFAVAIAVLSSAGIALTAISLAQQPPSDVSGPDLVQQAAGQGASDIPEALREAYMVSFGEPRRRTTRPAETAMAGFSPQTNRCKTPARASLALTRRRRVKSLR